jgi:DNA polymerase III epsilon subunit-like protein
VKNFRDPGSDVGVLLFYFSQDETDIERPLAFFDLETTGVKIGRDRIVQIGIVRLMPDGSRESYQTLGEP